MSPFLPLIAASGEIPPISMKDAAVGYFRLERAAQDEFWRGCFAQPQYLLAEFLNEIIMRSEFQLSDLASVLMQPDNAIPYRVAYSLTVTVWGYQRSWDAIITQLMAMPEAMALSWMRLWHLPCMSKRSGHDHSWYYPTLSIELVKRLMPQPALLSEFVRFDRFDYALLPVRLLITSQFDLFAAIDDASTKIGMKYWREPPHWNEVYSCIGELSLAAWKWLRVRHYVTPGLVKYGRLSHAIQRELASPGPHGDDHYDAIIAEMGDRTSLNLARQQRLVSLAVCVTDGFLRLREAANRVRRFFDIMSQLPYELQAIVTMRYSGLGGHCVTSVPDAILHWALKKSC